MFLDQEKEFPGKERFAKFRTDKEGFMLSDSTCSGVQNKILLGRLSVDSHDILVVCHASLPCFHGGARVLSFIKGHICKHTGKSR